MNPPRHLLLTSIVFVLSLPVLSQVYEEKVEYDKKKQQAFVVDYPYPQEAVENAIVDKIREMGYKAKEEKGLFNKDKGFIVFKKAIIEDIEEKKLDYIVKIERKSKKDKDETTLYLLLNEDGEDAFASLSAKAIGRAKAFLNNLIPEIEEAYLELQIEEQEAIVSKAEKKAKDLKDEQESLEKKIKGLQSDLEKNTREKEEHEQELEAQKQTLDNLKRKRK